MEDHEPGLHDMDPILNFHFEFNKQGYVPLYLNELANFGRKHEGQHQVGNEVGSWIDIYNAARKAYRHRLLSSGQPHIWKSPNGSEIGRVASSRLKWLIPLTRILRLRLLQPHMSRFLGLCLDP
jgi:hypothetical protein